MIKKILKQSVILSITLICHITLAQKTVEQKLISKIDSLFEPKPSTKPGYAVGVFKDGEVFLEKGYGLANIEYNVPITSETVFELASLSKQFTAACIHSLVSEGKLALDDPIRKYIPELPEYKEGRTTVRQLLHHTSGQRDYLKLMYLSGIPWDANFNDENALRLVQKQTALNFVPGERYQYSNTGYLLLAILIKRISGMSVSAYANSKLFDPIGMSRTTIHDKKGVLVKNRAIGYQLQKDEYITEHYYNFIAPGDGGVLTTIRDYFKWNENFKTNKTDVPNLFDKLLVRGITNSGDTLAYASGLIHSWYRGVRTIVHSGSWAAFNSMYVRFPPQDLSVVVLSNLSGGQAWQKAYQIIDLFFDEGVLQQPIAQNQEANEIFENPGQEISKRALEKFSGDYFNPIAGYSRRVYIKNDTLRYQRSVQNESALLPISENEFTMLGSSQISVRFEGREGGMKMSFQFPGEQAIVSEEYTPRNYSNAELQKFIGSYYSEEQDLTYGIFVENDSLVITLGHIEIARVNSIMENVFNQEHFGYLRFEYNDKDEVISFTVNDELVRNIRFEKIKTS